LYRFPIPAQPQVHFEAVLEPATPAVDKLRREAGVGEGEINIFRGKKNKLAISVYEYGNLIDRMEHDKEEISYDIKKEKDRYDFHYAVLTCSFLPDNDCRFDWGRFGVELSARSITGEPLATEPTALYLFPKEVNSEIKYKREVKTTPELKLSLFDVVEAGVGAQISSSKEFVIYEPQIFGFGIGKPTIAWNFSKTKGKGILGDKLLLVVIKAPKDSKVKGRFLLGAEVSSHLSNWIPIPVSKRKDDAVEAEYDLSH
jgi:hypothetical protein